MVTGMAMLTFAPGTFVAAVLFVSVRTERGPQMLWVALGGRNEYFVSLVLPQQPGFVMSYHDGGFLRCTCRLAVLWDLFSLFVLRRVRR